jgi:hypothetical protein
LKGNDRAIGQAFMGTDGNALPIYYNNFLSQRPGKSERGFNFWRFSAVVET